MDGSLFLQEKRPLRYPRYRRSHCPLFQYLLVYVSPVINVFLIEHKGWSQKYHLTQDWVHYYFPFTHSANIEGLSYFSFDFPGNQ